MIQDTAEFLSLVLTFPAIVLFTVVIYVFARQSFAAIRSRKLNSVQWLILGVFIGFVGSHADNLFWFVAWYATYMGYDTADSLMQSGVYFNIPSRQMAGIAAAYCHLMSIVSDKPQSVKNVGIRRLNKTLTISLIVGLIAMSVSGIFRG